jgi:hypothetical protein
LIPASDETDEEFEASFVRTIASIVSDSSDAAVIAALLFALTSEPLSSINMSADIKELPFDLIH